jgi:hypothetical protein
VIVTVIAVLCSLSTPACIEEIVTDSNLEPELSFQGCMITGQIGISKWMGEHPIYHANWRLDRWKCVPGHYEIRGKA